MSRDERALVIERQTPSSAGATNESLDEAPEEPLTRLKRIALPVAQRKVGARRTPGAAIAITRILAAIGAYSLPALALCIAIGAVGYSTWVVVDVAQSAGSLEVFSGPGRWGLTTLGADGPGHRGTSGKSRAAPPRHLTGSLTPTSVSPVGA